MASKQKKVFAYTIIIKCFFNRVTRKATVKLIKTILLDFFWPQFETRFKPSIRPVVPVDHPLDKLIPFRPEYISTYLSFIPVYLRALNILYINYGKTAYNDINDFLIDLENCYFEAGKIYKKSQSTTKRPGVRLNPGFIMVHLTDPHFHCVPSLHVIVMCFTSMRIRSILRKHTSPSESFDLLYEDIYRQAIEITDSILFVKQHSVNCLAAGFYFMSVKFPTFNADKVSLFINDLFKGKSELARTDEIKTFIYDTYLDFMNQFSDRKYAYFGDVLLSFLANYNIKA